MKRSYNDLVLSMADHLKAQIEASRDPLAAALAYARIGNYIDFGAMDTVDGAWLGAPSGVIRKDNSVKASYEMLRKLIHEEWHTARSCRTDENGWTCVEGFKGSYRMTAGGASAEFELGSADFADRVILR